MHGTPPRALDRLASLPAIVGLGLALRLAGVAAVERYVRGKWPPFVFPDTGVYWLLAEQIRLGRPFVVVNWGVPHYALRTPGYPLFLAGCQLVFGGRNFLAARLVQSALGAACVWLVARLTAAVAPEEATRPGWSAVKVAALWAAVDPYVVALSPILLTEAVFVPLMLAGLWGQARLWGGDGGRRSSILALLTGAAHGAAVLVRPSWAPLVPPLVLAWPALARGRRAGAMRGALLIALGAALVMAPWWARNARVYGRFVPTALWAGASLYDGLRPGAEGGSDMRFLDDPAIRAIDESAQDALLARRAVRFARDNPGRALGLAAIKAARFWSPWPNEPQFRRPALMAAGAVATIPFYMGTIVGIWKRRRDGRALVLLLGPLAGTALMHLAFVGSVRYRVPVAVPALGLAALGLRSAGAGGRER